MPNISRQEWRTDRAAKNAVTIGLGPRRMPGVKVRSDFFHFENPHGRGQDIIQSLDEIGCRHCGLRNECRDLA